MEQKIKQFLGYLAILLAVFLLVYLGFLIKGQYDSPVDISKIRTITMSAEGKVTGTPDIATVSFSVVTQGATAEQTQKENDAKMTKVTDFLKSKGVNESDIQTSGYNLYPQYNYNQNQQPPPITGYSQSQQVSVKIRDLNLLKTVTAGLTGQGVNQIDNLTFSIDDPDKLRSEARQKATDKARAKADELASKLGVKLGKVVNFSEGVGVEPVYGYALADASGYGGGGSSPIQPGSQDVNVTVTLTFELK